MNSLEIEATSDLLQSLHHQSAIPSMTPHSQLYMEIVHPVCKR